MCDLCGEEEEEDDEEENHDERMEQNERISRINTREYIPTLFPCLRSKLKDNKEYTRIHVYVLYNTVITCVSSLDKYITPVDVYGCVYLSFYSNNVWNEYIQLMDGPHLLSG